MKGAIVQATEKLLAFVLVFGLALPSHAATVEYIHTDALGSPVAVTDSSGVVIERREYEPYGLQLLPTPVKDGPGYTGHVSDAATGLDYMQQRYYDPQLGRFLSSDPVTVDIASGANFNRYRYAANNPYRFTDPDGRKQRDRRSLNYHSSNRGNVGSLGSGTQTQKGKKDSAGSESSGSVPAEIDEALQNPDSRADGLRKLADYNGMLVPPEDITYQNQDGPIDRRSGRRAAATTTKNPARERPLITFYANSFNNYNFWVISSNLDHEYGHWLDLYLGLGDKDLDEIRAYQFQMRSSNLKRAPSYYQTGIRVELDSEIRGYECNQLQNC